MEALSRQAQECCSACVAVVYEYGTEYTLGISGKIVWCYLRQICDAVHEERRLLL